jgi:hypothetical protein
MCPFADVVASLSPKLYKKIETHLLSYPSSFFPISSIYPYRLLGGTRVATLFFVGNDDREVAMLATGMVNNPTIDREVESSWM